MIWVEIELKSSIGHYVFLPRMRTMGECWVGERIIAMKTERTTKIIKLINLLKNLIKLIN